MSIDHADAVAAPESDPACMHNKAGMTVIVTDTEDAWRMADVIWVDGGKFMVCDSEQTCFFSRSLYLAEKHLEEMEHGYSFPLLSKLPNSTD